MEKQEFAVEVQNRLCAIYGCPIRHWDEMDPLSELVSSLLSHRTKNRDAKRAFDALVERFGTWHAVRDGEVAIIQEALRPCTWPEQKAPRLKHILQKITELRGDLSLDFLGTMPVAEARAWLEALPGVGPKTSAATLSFSILRARALPVDSHHFRVAVRLGLIDAKIGEAKAHKVLEDMLPPDFDAQQVFDNHQVMMRLGQKICFHHNPACPACPLLDFCPTGRARLGMVSQHVNTHLLLPA